MSKRTFTMVCKKLDLAKSKMLYWFNSVDSRRPGYFGFGVYESCAEYSNLKVWRPHWTDIGERTYVPGTKMAQKRGR